MKNEEEQEVNEWMNEKKTYERINEFEMEKSNATYKHGIIASKKLKWTEQSFFLKSKVSCYIMNT